MGKITIYGSNFQAVNLTPNGGVSSTEQRDLSIVKAISINQSTLKI